MKRLGSLYNSMISYRNINYIFNKVKNNCHNKEKIYEFLKFKNSNYVSILKDLKNENYKFYKYSIFLIKEKKYRIIMSENISDKIVNQMISYFILMPTLKNLIDTNVATRKNKGTSYAYNAFEKYIRELGVDKKIYVLKIDISKYFYNIDHNILYSMLEKRIKDKKALKILKQLIELTDDEYINTKIKELINNEIKRVYKLNISSEEKNRKINELNNIPLYKKGKGLSIGCLSNQLLALFYLSGIDNYIKEELKHKYYIRYQDDLYILDTDKEKLKKSFDLIVNKLNDLKLTSNKKSGIYNINNGIDFLGYTYVLKNKRLIIKYTNNTIRKINRKLRKKYIIDFNGYYKSINSYRGYFEKCNTNLYFDKYKLAEVNTGYDKYKIVKKKFNDSIVFVRYKNKYYTYGSDLDKINKLLKKKTRKRFYSWELYKIRDKMGNFIVLKGQNILINEIN